MVRGLFSFAFGQSSTLPGTFILREYRKKGLDNFDTILNQKFAILRNDKKKISKSYD